jgi:hypothetical protein
MQKLILIPLFVLLAPRPALAETLAPGYVKALGYSSIAASAVGYPEFGKYDPAQFQYRNGKFFIEAGSTLDLRAILPMGMTIGNALTKVKQERGANLKHHQEDFMSFRIWASHDGGMDLVGNNRWPQKLDDVPIWEPVTNTTFAITAESGNWPSAGAGWDDLKGDMSILNRAKVGHKFYVVFSVGYRYKTPGGEIENKWDDVLHKFVPVKSTGMLGFVYGAPLAACTIEIGAGADESSRFKAGTDGTITDTKTGLVWAQKAEGSRYYSDLPGQAPGAVSYASSFKGGGWRLPTREEMVELRKVGGEKPVAWFNAHGFSIPTRDAYVWTSSAQGARIWVVDLNGTGDPGVMDKEDVGCIWPVKGK